MLDGCRRHDLPAPELCRGDGAVRHVHGGCLFLRGLTGERDDHSADECEAEPGHRGDDVPCRLPARE